MKLLKQYPFLILLGLGALGSLALGIRECARRGDGEAIQSYLDAHEETPFWTDLMPDRFRSGEEMLAEELSQTSVGEEAESTSDHPDANPEEAGLAAADPEETEGTENVESSEAQLTETDGQDPAGQMIGADAPDPAAIEDTNTGIYFDEELGLWASRCAVNRTYEPAQTDSRYYKDRGLTPLTPDYGFTEVEDDYFADAAFVGDSRMLGLHDYSGWSGSADFYCENGFSVYRWVKGAKTVLQSAEQKGKGTEVDLREAFSNKTYGKVYLLAGMNDLGYGNTELFQGWMQQLIDMVRETQPDATIYLLGNLHISKSQDGAQPAMDNLNTNDKNLALSGLADGETVFYLDANELFCDEEGYLRDDITFDGYHLYAANYVEWADFIRQHAVIR